MVATYFIGISYCATVQEQIVQELASVGFLCILCQLKQLFTIFIARFDIALDNMKCQFKTSGPSSVNWRSSSSGEESNHNFHELEKSYVEKYWIRIHELAYMNQLHDFLRRSLSPTLHHLIGRVTAILLLKTRFRWTKLCQFEVCIQLLKTTCVYIYAATTTAESLHWWNVWYLLTSSSCQWFNLAPQSIRNSVILKKWPLIAPSSGVFFAWRQAMMSIIQNFKVKKGGKSILGEAATAFKNHNFREHAKMMYPHEPYFHFPTWRQNWPIVRPHGHDQTDSRYWEPYFHPSE